MGFFKKKRQSGAALLVILAVSAMILPLIQGVWLDSQVHYKLTRHRLSEIQARYNAKSGIGLNLLRLHIFKAVEKSFGGGAWDPMIRPFLDTSWSFPLAWPLPIPKDFLESEKDEMKALEKKSFFQGAYRASITPVDGFLDINDLSSPLVPLRKFTYETLLNLLLFFVEEEPQLKENYDRKKLEKILNNLSDWTDLDNDSQNGGREELLEEGKKPLNRSFISIEEIQKVPGMSPEIYQLLKPYITVYGAKALNINYAPKEILRALNLSEELVEQILYRTQRNSEAYKPFLDQKSFCDFMRDLEGGFCGILKDRYQSLKMLNFSYPVAFRIKSQGEHKGSSVRLEALLYDLSSMALGYQEFRYYEMLKNQAENSHSPLLEEETRLTEKNQQKKQKFNYSYYQSLIIMYIKENL